MNPSTLVFYFFTFVLTKWKVSPSKSIQKCSADYFQEFAIFFFLFAASVLFFMGHVLLGSHFEVLPVIDRHAYRPEKIGTVLKIRDKIKSVLPFCLILSRSKFQRSLQSFKTESQYATLNYFFFYTLKK